MKSIRLDEQELSSFLAEINSQEAAELPDDLLSDKAWINEIEKDENGICHKAIKLTEDVYGEKRKKGIHNRVGEANTKKQRKKEIIQEAINDSFIDLNALITIEQKRLLLEHEASKYTNKMKSFESQINKTFFNFIYYRLPKAVRYCWEEYPQIMIPLEPFNYQASEDFGKGYAFKISINVPSYFSSEQILSMMQLHKPESLMYADRAIANFYKYKDSRTSAENRLANKLINIKTFYQLLKKEPLLYEVLINILKNKL